MKPDEVIELWTPLFSRELDGSDFERFDRYKRWFVEHEEKAREAKASPRAPAVRARATVGQVLRNLIDSERERNPEFVKRYPELEDPAVFKEMVRNFEAEWKARGKEAAKKREMHDSKVLAQFDARRFDGPDDWVYRKTFKEVVREALVEYLSDPCSGPYPGLVAEKPEELRPGLVAEALSWKALRPLRHLRTLAEQGDNKALQLLAEIAIPLVKVVNERAGKDPASLGCVPQRFRFWPALKSEHPDFDEDHRKLLKQLRVGQDFPLVISESARWKAQDAVGRWAIHLCQEIDIMQTGYQVDEKSKLWQLKFALLGPFSGETWKDWWEVAQGLLLDEYVDVVEIPELRETVTAKADLRSPGRVRKRILQALKDKFKSMAGGNKL